MVRTSTIMERFKLYLDKSNLEIRAKLLELNAKVLTDAMIFEKRRDVFDQLDKIIEKVAGFRLETEKDTVPEYLFYSHLGRGDLISFQSWLENFREKNDV